MKRVHRPHAWQSREARIPLYLPVVTEPPLVDCWAVNVSLSGVGLVASRAPEETHLPEGQIVTLELALPDLAEPLVVKALLQWSEDTTASYQGRISTALGLRFVDVPTATQSRLVAFFESYRPHVALFMPTAAERTLCQQALNPQVELHEAPTLTALEEILARGDVAAVLLCGADAQAAQAALTTLAQSRPDDHDPLSAVHQDLSPRVLWAAAYDASAMLRAFNNGQLFALLERPLAPDALSHAVLRACGDFGVRTEQHRAGLALERALLRERDRGRAAGAWEQLADTALVAESAAMREVLEAVRIVAPHKTTALFVGETGTGKELLARLLHQASDRAHAAFLAQDCGALTETLLDSELFGHVKGAFTGAVNTHPGLFVLADGGTIFLDEIENMSAALQAKLLRVLETGEVRPVGGSKVRRVDVRVIAATNQELLDAVQRGRLRADLYYRLSTFPITIPPLRARREDILPLAESFRLKTEQLLRRHTTGFDAYSRAQLYAHDWPGNVRELRNTIERSILFANDDAPLVVRLPPAARGTAAPSPSGNLEERLHQLERSLIRDALLRHGGVIRRAARELGVNAITLGRKIKTHGLQHELAVERAEPLPSDKS